MVIQLWVFFCEVPLCYFIAWNFNQRFPFHLMTFCRLSGKLMILRLWTYQQERFNVTVLVKFLIFLLVRNWDLFYQTHFYFYFISSGWVCSSFHTLLLVASDYRPKWNTVHPSERFYEIRSGFQRHPTWRCVSTEPLCHVCCKNVQCFLLDFNFRICFTSCHYVGTVFRIL